MSTSKRKTKSIRVNAKAKFLKATTKQIKLEVSFPDIIWCKPLGKHSLKQENKHKNNANHFMQPKHPKIAALVTDEGKQHIKGYLDNRGTLHAYSRDIDLKLLKSDIRHDEEKLLASAETHIKEPLGKNASEHLHLENGISLAMKGSILDLPVITPSNDLVQRQLMNDIDTLRKSKEHVDRVDDAEEAIAQLVAISEVKEAKLEAKALDLAEHYFEPSLHYIADVKGAVHPIVTVPQKEL